MLSESQLTQVKSLVQATINETIEQTAAAAAQAAVNAFTGSSPSSQAVVPERKSSSFFLPKNFNSLQLLRDEPLTLTLENSVFRANKAKATSITNIEEWTSAFTAYMSVVISKHPSRAAELLEYLSLIRYAAKYHRGLGWCVYDVKFRKKAAANKFIKWSTIDSQQRLKTFTVAPSLMRFFSSQDPHPSQVQLEGMNILLATTLTRVFMCQDSLHLCTQVQQARLWGDHPGIRCPFTPEPEKQPPPRAGKSNSEHHS